MHGIIILDHSGSTANFGSNAISGSGYDRVCLYGTGDYTNTTVESGELRLYQDVNVWDLMLRGLVA